MPNKTLDRDLLDQVIEIANLDYDEIREDYSGRGMDGRTCFGIVMRPGAEREVFAGIGYVAGMNEAGGDGPDDVDLFDLVRCARSDSMGRDVIVYFPGWTLT